MNWMRKLRAGLCLAALTASGSAFAGGYHQICYQDRSTSAGLLTATFGCRADDPSISCTVDLAGNSTWGAGGLLRKVTMYSSGLYALEKAAPADAARLRAGLGRPDADVEDLRGILRGSGAEASARADAEKLCDEALRALASDTLPERVARDLREIALYTVRRAL